MKTFDALLSDVRAAEKKLANWGRALNDPKKFQPVIKCEWNRAFDKREKLKTDLCRMNRARYAIEFPDEPNDR